MALDLDLGFCKLGLPRVTVFIHELLLSSFVR